MKKPAHDAPAIEQLAYGICMIQDERQEACIHCKDVWYAIHHKDGVCHKCQRLGLPGRAKIARHEHLKECALSALFRVAILVIVVAVASVLYNLIW
jgi:hypothetical protein